MGIFKRIKNSYVFTQLEVGKYTKRRTSANGAEIGTIRAGTVSSVDEFDRAGAELQAEQLAEERARSTSRSAETLAGRHVGRVRSSMDLTAAARERLGGRTAVSTPQTSPTPASFDAEVRPRPRPRPARTARSTAEMQSVYFAPGRNVTMTNQQKQRMSTYPKDSLPSFDKNSASSTDYYVFAPTARQMSTAPLDARRRQMRGVVGPEEDRDPHRREELSEIHAQSTNPFVERRRNAHKMVEQGWNSSSPFDDPLVGSGRGGIDPNHPRKHLNTPVYANQAGSMGLDLLA
ncbi:hypothetical protein IWW50_000689 [Coemansia erecta]|nr:hypothetical protein IWW50_000689 [Coemansia erecta]